MPELPQPNASMAKEENNARVTELAYVAVLETAFWGFDSLHAHFVNW